MNIINYILFVIATAWLATPATQAGNQYTPRYNNDRFHETTKTQEVLEGFYDTAKPVLVVAVIYFLYRAIQHVIEHRFFSSGSSEENPKKTTQSSLSQNAVSNLANEEPPNQQHM